MTHAKQRLSRSLIAITSVTLAWLLFDLAGVWSQARSITQFLCFMFCVLGIDRVMSAAIDLVTIAAAPIETIKRNFPQR